MKRFFVFLLLLLVIPACSFAESIQNVSRMDITIHFSYGDRSGVYTGGMKDGVPHGYGCFETQNSLGKPWVYVGEFKDGIFCGIGYQFWPGDVQTSKGQFENGHLVSGQLVNLIGGYTFDGVFTDDDNITGEGKIYDWNNTLIFEGTFDNGVFQEGTLYNDDGTVAATGTFGEGFAQLITDNYIQGYIYY